MHIWEAGTRRKVLSSQRMFWEEIDVVGDNHQVANLKLRIHATSSIRDKERLDAQFVHHTNREGYLLHRVALIEMKASLHGEDVDASQLTKYQFSAMSFDGRYWEVGDFLVGDFVFVSYFGS